MAVIKYKDPNTGEYISEVYVEDAVASVNGETGVINLDAEDIPYDASETHAEGSIGAELSSQSSAIAEIIAANSLLVDDEDATITVTAHGMQVTDENAVLI